MPVEYVSATLYVSESKGILPRIRPVRIRLSINGSMSSFGS